MHFSYIRPSVLLAPYIKHYWILESDATDGEVCERVIPTDFIEWMFLFQGIPEELVRVENSYTGRFLKPYLI